MSYRLTRRGQRLKEAALFVAAALSMFAFCVLGAFVFAVYVSLY